MIKIYNLVKKFHGAAVLNDISLEIDGHGVVGLAGPSGSGKSTLLRCIQGLDAPDSGTISAPQNSTFMFQDFQLFPHMTVLENLVYAPRVLKHVGDHMARAMEFLDKLGMTDKAECYPKMLSGGQKQRVALARNLMLSPDLLICDEPTSGLDVATIEDVVEIFESAKTLGVKILIASHDLNFITKVASRIILLKQGVVVADINTCETMDPIQYLREFY